MSNSPLSAVRREDTVIRYGGVGDCWHMSWAGDDLQYVSLCDGYGFDGQPRAQLNTRLYAIEGGPLGATIRDVPGYPLLGPPVQSWGDPRYYGFGTLALRGRIYQFLSTFNTPLATDEVIPTAEHSSIRFTGAKLIYSADNGNSWYNQDSTPIRWEGWDNRSRRTMAFFEEDQEAFSMLSILQMGKDYECNRDGYVYVYSPNGNTEGTMNELVMFKVRADRILHRGDYEYFAGYSSSDKPRWTRDIEARAIVHTFPSGWVGKHLHPYSWLPSVSYVAGADLYLMANWGTGNDESGNWFAKASYLGLWVSQNPWGPWTQIHEETAWTPAGDTAARAFQPQIAPKWIAPDGKSFWLAWTDIQTIDATGLQNAGRELAKKPRDAWSAGDWAQRSYQIRKHNPYYSFNIQRVDLTVR